MKLRYLYPIALLTLFAVFVTCGGAIFGYDVTEFREQITPEKQYTYVSRYAELSEHDIHFRDAADIIGYDWTLIAAIAFTESRFDSTAVSSAGATGIMQVMPNTLRGFNIPDSMHMNARTNIFAATELLRSLDKRFSHVKDPAERINFVLASYNAGYGHILDAMRFAKREGKNRFVWKNNVDTFLILKSQPEYYNDTLCRNGKFEGWRETLQFVTKVQRNWRRFKRTQQLYSDSISRLIESDSTFILME